ncbi:hypothetical protein MP638_003264 [Amoeboaphelidium occidentale]|nr:hypothetical protein MP638_003264 [Amoeboaphelidium occidentale]
MSQFYPIPDNYTSPEWPGLSLEKPVILYYGLDLWLFITLWTTVLTASCYFFAFLWSYAAYYKIRWYFVVPILATIIGAIIGFVSGSIIGSTIYRIDIYDWEACDALMAQFYSEQC